MLVLALLLLVQQAAAKPAAPAFFTTPYPMTEMQNKQAVVETSAGTFVIQLLPEAAPNHVGFFMKTAREGGYTGTLFHRVIRYGIIQGGDPLSRDPAKAGQYGQGGLRQLRAEKNAEKHTAGAVSGVLVPGQPDSAGTQFFVCASDQPALDGEYTVFGRIVDGFEIVQQISAADADARGMPAKRIEIKGVTIRDTPPEPFINDTPVDLARYKSVLETTMGKMEIEFLTDKAPETSRAFLRMAQAGVFDGTAVHRVVPNFVMQTGAIAYRDTPLTPRQQKLVQNLKPEFNDTPTVVGVVSMARGEDPASATTSFFICIGECRALDNTYTAFARVTAGMDVLKAIAAVPVDGETPKTPIVLRQVTVEKK
jgi:peptidyl-prolyl cis-trans isomerase B (cyclophilin B)